MLSFYCKSHKSLDVWFCESSRCNSWGPLTCNSIVAGSRSTPLLTSVLSRLVYFLRLRFPLKYIRRYALKGILTRGPNVFAFLTGCLLIASFLVGSFVGSDCAFFLLARKESLRVRKFRM